MMKEPVDHKYICIIYESAAVLHRLHGIHQMDPWEDQAHCMQIQLSPSTTHFCCVILVLMYVSLSLASSQCETHPPYIAHVQESLHFFILFHKCMHTYEGECAFIILIVSHGTFRTFIKCLRSGAIFHRR